METKGNVDPHLVRIENTLDEHQRRRKGGVDREGLEVTSTGSYGRCCLKHLRSRPSRKTSTSEAYPSGLYPLNQDQRPGGASRLAAFLIAH